MRRDKTIIARQHGFHQMNDEELAVMLRVCVSTTGTVEQALTDMRMIDDLLHLKRVSGFIKNPKGRPTIEQRKIEDMMGNIISPSSKNEDLIIPDKKGHYGFAISGKGNLSHVCSEKSLLKNAKIFGFSKKQVDKILKKPRGFKYNSGDWQMIKL